MIKTNVMRILDSKNINYEIIDWSGKDLIELNKEMEKNNSIICKTLVTVAKSKEHYVFVIPVNKELDLKKAAKVANEKNIEMIHQKDLLPLTGYIHGGCSPLGMKKYFKTFFDETINIFDFIIFSAGKVGLSIKIKASDLTLAFNSQFSIESVV